MESSFLAQAAKFLREQKQNKRWLLMFLCFAIAVALGTVAALRMYGQAMTHQVKNLDCQVEIHQHEDACWNEDDELICGYADYMVHIHNDDCYDFNGKLVCKLPEIEVHEHTEECYEEQEVLLCGRAESPGHQHTISCYGMTKSGLACGTEEHTHNDFCYEEQEILVCQESESEEHEHTEECYALQKGGLVCGLEEHSHSDDCYDWQEDLVCGYQEGDGGHRHTDACYGPGQAVVCGYLELHTHEDDCFDNEGYLICGMVQLEEHVHGDDCFRIMELTKEEIDILNRAGQNSGGTKTYEGEGYTVTAVYDAIANIPEDAELIARLITPEDDPEHYAQREEEFQTTLEDEEISMSALFEIGFYVDGEEIEPRSAVTITVQFLDENGLADGEPITVVHFGEEGTEVLDGSDAEDNSTTFEMESFSEIAIGRKGMGKVVEISESFSYADDGLDITFYIEGKVRLAAEKDDDGLGESVVPEEGLDAVSEEGSVDAAAADVGSQPDAENQISPAEEQADVTGEEAGAGAEDTASPNAGDDAAEPDAGADDTQETENSADAAAADVQRVAGTEDPSLILEVAQLPESSAEFVAISQCVKELEGEDSEPLLLGGMKLSLKRDDQEIPLDACQVTARISPAKSLVEQAEELSENDEEELNDIRLSLFGLREDNQAVRLDDMLLNTAESEGQEAKIMEIELGAASVQSDTFGVSATGLANVNFTVQYYANIETVIRDKDSAGNTPAGVALPVIDTSGVKGGNLPKNGETPKTSNIYVSTEESNKGEAAHETSLVEIYTEKKCDINTYPELKNFNKFDPNAEIKGDDTTQKRDSNYDVVEVWVLVDGKEADSVNPKDWDVYKTAEPKFTNDPELKEDGYIVLKEGAVVRLVGEPTKNPYNNSAVFYDYDISNGWVYRAIPPTNQGPGYYQHKTAGEAFSGNSLTSSILTWASGLNYWDKHLYTYTKEQGINSSGNYSGSGTKLAFGNVNTGTNLGRLTWNTNELNKYNNKGYKGCTFGLVKGLDGNGHIIYADGIIAPKLFNEGNATGKTAYNDYSLDFIRTGDTYTLTAVNGTGATGLNKFNHPTNSTGTHSDIWTNNFWPMDSADSFGTGTHDIKFGGTATFKGKTNEIRFGPITQKEGDYTFPESDDGLYHNSYFGMSFSLTFDLTEDYVGPLNYYFYGDDDMWVFLDGKLICDIGGVHSSVGEYVDLWDHITKGSDAAGTHSLSFFYTERGASGSTCWMQFTLPSASGCPVAMNPGEFKSTLTVHKAVSGESVNTDQAFEFTLHLKGSNGEPLPNYYDCDILDSSNHVIRSESIKDGGIFSLRNGESILVKKLPEKATYTISEKEYGSYKPDMTGTTGTVKADTTFEGTMDYTVDDNVSYNNVVVGYALPETGGIGTRGVHIAGLLQITIAAALLGYKQTRRRKGGMGR